MEALWPGQGRCRLLEWNLQINEGGKNGFSRSGAATAKVSMMLTVSNLNFKFRLKYFYCFKQIAGFILAFFVLFWLRNPLSTDNIPFTYNGSAALLPLQVKDLLLSFLSPETGKLSQIYSATSPNVLILHSDYKLHAWTPVGVVDVPDVCMAHSVKGEYHGNSDIV